MAVIKLHKITFVFPIKLEGDRLDVWLDNVGIIPDLAMKEMEERKKKAKENRILAWAAGTNKATMSALEAGVAHLSIIQSRFKSLAELKQVDDRTWMLTLPEASQLIDYKLPYINKRIMPEIISPDTIIKRLKRDIFPKKTRTGFIGMDIEPDSITVQDIDVIVGEGGETGLGGVA